MFATNGNCGSRRIFIGNLSNSVDESVLRNEFSSYGTVDKVEVKTKGFDEFQSKFAFVTLQYTTEQDLSKCIKRFSREKFHGNYLKVEVARESFLDKLKRERDTVQINKNDNTEIPQNQFQHQEISTSSSNTTKSTKVDKKKVESSSSSSSSESVSDAAKKDKKIIKVTPAKIIPKKKADSSSSSSSTSSSSDSESDSLENYIRNLKITYALKETNQQDDDTTFFIAKKNAHSSVQNGKIRINEVGAEPIHVVSKTNRTQQRHLEGSAEQSDKKRKESLHKMKDQYDRQKLAIKEALRDVDSAKKSTKIVFNDSDEDVSKDLSNSKPTSKNQELFKDDEDSDDYNKHFEIKQQYQGEQGEKLMKLQSKFKLDSRFAMDSRFLEDENNGNDERMDATTTDENDERKWQLNIMEQVVGKKIATDKPPVRTPAKGLITRFDPTNENHQKFYKSEKDDDVELELTEQITGQENDVPVSDERYYKVSDDFKKSLETSGKGFSLLAMLGRSEEPPERNDNNAKYPEITFTTTRISSLNVDNPFEYDSSESDDDDDADKEQSSKTKPNQTTSKSNNAIKTKKSTECFFLFGTDNRLEEGAKFFDAPNINPDRDYDEVRRNLRKIIYRKIIKKRKFTEGFQTTKSKFKKSRKV